MNVIVRLVVDDEGVASCIVPVTRCCTDTIVRVHHVVNCGASGLIIISTIIIVHLVDIIIDVIIELVNALTAQFARRSSTLTELVIIGMRLASSSAMRFARRRFARRLPCRLTNDLACLITFLFVSCSIATFETFLAVALI